MQSWDVIVIGGGIIGLSLSIALRHSGASVLILERGEPGREASHAAAGMLAALGPETPELMLEMAKASTRLYPEYVRELEASSGLHIDFQQEGTIYLSDTPPCQSGIQQLSSEQVQELEPAIEAAGRTAWFLQEQRVDPRLLTEAALKTARNLGVDVHSGTKATELIIANQRVTGVHSERSFYLAPTVVNCAGAWAAEITGPTVPSRPVKGQMLDVIPRRRPLLKHTVRSSEVYAVPRRDGRIVIGATIEEAGFDKNVQPEVIQHLHQLAANLIPELGEARIHEAWAGLRPGSPDDLPIMGATPLEGYFVATGHYRNGILLAPITASCMADLIQGRRPQIDLSPFSPERFCVEKI